MRRDTTRRRRRRATMAALGLGLALALAACGGSPDGDRVASLGGDGGQDEAGGSATTTTRRDPQQAALDYAKCMRAHGIDMPDPEVDDQGRVTMRIGGPDGQGGARPDPKKLQAAQQACGSLMGGGDGPGPIDPEARDAMVDYARCMRAHGVDMPDPKDGGLLMRKGEGPDPESAAFQEADKACKHHLGGLGRPEREAGGRS